MYWSRWWYGDMVAGGWWGGKVRRGQEESLGDERRMGFGPWKLCQFSSVSIGEKDVLYRLLGEEEWTIVETKEGGWSKVESVGHGFPQCCQLFRKHLHWVELHRPSWNQRLGQYSQQEQWQKLIPELVPLVHLCRHHSPRWFQSRPWRALCHSEWKGLFV